MAIFQFEKGDIVRNTIKAFPLQSFYIYDSSVYESEIFPSSSLDVYSILTKDNTLASFKTITVGNYNSQFSYGDQITGPSMTFFTSSISRYHYLASGERKYVTGTLKNSYEFYKKWSPHFAMSSSLGNKATQKLTLINIPSIYYGSKIKKGSVHLKYYFTGTLAAEVKDIYGNGELIQTGPEDSTGSGSVAGVCMYNEGIITLTGSWDVSEADDFGTFGSGNGKWVHFGTGIEPDFPTSTCTASSFEMSFQGVTKTPSMTLFCNAPKGMLNYSSNPTFTRYGQNLSATSSSVDFVEPKELLIKNINEVPYDDPTGSFERVTYVSRVNVYDENMNLIGIAKLATPIKKTEARDLTFKIKVDL